MISRRLLMWVLLGIPIYGINYLLFMFVFWIFGNHTLAYWSWPLAAPLTLWMWDHLDQRTNGSGNSVLAPSSADLPLGDRI